jgi:predicted ester cyclase
MAVTFTIELPSGKDTRAKLDEIRKHLGINGDEEAADGMLCHLESETATGYRIIDVWESEAHMQRFFETRLGAAFAAAGFDPLQGHRPALENVISLVQRQRVASYDAMVRELNDAFTNNDASVFDRYLADDFVEHEQLGPTPGREGVKQMVAGMHESFANFTMQTLDVVSAAGRATSRVRITGKHVGEFMGIPATGRDVDVEAFDSFAIGSDGLVHEHWGLFDQAKFLGQLGVIPAQAGAPAIELPQEART